MRNAFVLLSLLVSFSMLSIRSHATEPGLYLGGGVGAYSMDIDDTSFDDSATVAKVFAGYRLHKHLAVEADYQKLFETKDDLLGVETELDADVWTFAVRPIIPLTDFVDLYAKAGYAWYDVEAQTNILGVPITEDGSDSEFTWGGGLDVNLGNLSLRGEYSRIDIKGADLNLVSAGVVFRF